MTEATWLKLLLVPGAVWLASLAARRWGHTASGYLGGMPLIGGPITLFLVLDQGAAFGAQSALVTLAAIAGQAAHCVAFAHVGARWGWMAGLAAGWSCYAAIAFTLAALRFPPWVGLAWALGGLLLAWRLLPRARQATALPVIPRTELALRLTAAFALAAFIVWGAATFGPVVSGLLLSIPITGSIMPPFTLKLHGRDALWRLLRGFVAGLFGFTAFFFTVASALPHWGVVGTFAVAIAAALAAVFAASRLNRGQAPA